MANGSLAEALLYGSDLDKYSLVSFVSLFLASALIVQARDICSACVYLHSQSPPVLHNDIRAVSPVLPIFIQNY